MQLESGIRNLRAENGKCDLVKLFLHIVYKTFVPVRISTRFLEVT